jgi:RecJ-like exonuclease
MPSTHSHPDDRCPTCHGEGEIETCMTCANAVDNCECDGDSLPEVEMEECSECDGTGDADTEEVA